MKTEIKIIEQEIIPIVKNALALSIESKMDLDTGVEILSALNRYHDKITEEKERITKPLLEALKVERGRWKKIETSYEKAIEHVRYQMSSYQTSQMKLEEKTAKDLAEGRIDMDQALATMSDTKVITQFGSVTFREQAVLKILDVNKTPREYMIVNEPEVLKALKAGVKVEGAEIELKAIPVNRR